MAIWGFGAYYKSNPNEDKTIDFIDAEKAYIGWDEKEAPPLYRMLDAIKIGDIVYIKSFVPKTKQLTIKGLGIVTNTKKEFSKNFGTGISVKWKKDFSPVTIDVTPEIYKNNVFNNTLYEEYNESVASILINELL